MIYLDNNSTTPIRPEVFEAMKPYLTERFFNPSASYQEGAEITKEIESAREFFAKSINAESPEEIYFVSCGSEANTWAIQRLDVSDLTVITDNIEHHSVLNALNQDAHITYADRQEGIFSIEGLLQAIEIERAPYVNRTPPKNILISCMWVNNEIGTIQPIKVIGDISNKYNTFFHVDAVQAYGKIPIDVQDNHIDMLSVSSHKIGAPRGCGFLYVRKGTPLKPLIYGGQQENYMRAGTENVAGIIGFKTAAEIAIENMDNNMSKLWELHDHMLDSLNNISGIRIINRDMEHIPSTISVDCGVPAEQMLAYLDQFSILVSSGSACNSKDDKPSHVLTALNMSDKRAGQVIRFSLSPDITFDQLDYVTEILEKGIELLGGGA